MPMSPDDEVCYCFHVSYRKVENFCRNQKPQFASQISECLSAGTGCGWCIPLLRKIHRETCGTHEPWWRQDADSTEKKQDSSHDYPTPEAYAAARQAYITAKNKPT